jgi:hypothetical protein
MLSFRSIASPSVVRRHSANNKHHFVAENK